VILKGRLTRVKLVGLAGGKAANFGVMLEGQFNAA